MIAGVSGASAQSASPDLTLSDPVEAARSISDWFHSPAADVTTSSYDDAVVILRRLQNEASASGLAGTLGLRRSKDRQALARDALAALNARGIDSAAIARRALDGIEAIPLPATGFDQRLVDMSEFLSLLPPAEAIDRRARFVLRHKAALSPARLRALAANLLDRLDHAPEEDFAAAALSVQPVLAATYGDAAARMLTPRLPSDMPPDLVRTLLSKLPATDGASSASLTAAALQAGGAARDRLMTTCASGSAARGQLIEAAACARLATDPQWRDAALATVASAMLREGYLARAEALLDMSANAEAKRDARAIAALRAIISPDSGGQKPETLPALDFARLSENARLALLTRLALTGLDIDFVVDRTPPGPLREMVERDVGLAELDAGLAVEAELRWRAMPQGRAWFRLGAALYVQARLMEDPELAGEIRSQLLVAASDGLSRFDTDISGLMLALTGQPPDGYSLSPAADALAARIAALDAPGKTMGNSVQALRASAELGAAMLDSFGMIGGRRDLPETAPAMAGLEPSPRNGGGVTITASVAPRAAPRPEIAALDQRRITAAWVRANLAMPEAPDAMLVSLNKQSGRYFEDLLGTLSTRDHVFAAQETIAPRFIRINSGVTSLGMLKAWLDAHDETLLAAEGGEMRIRLPIVIGPKATLQIDGSEFARVRLDTRAGAFIVNAGRLEIDGVALSATDGDAGFRPFITAWSGSSTIIAGSELSGLGYGGGSAHGLTIRSGPETVLRTSAGLAGPSALIVDSRLDGLYTAFLARGAGKVRLIGNLIENAAHGGLSPREETADFFAAYNTIRGVKGGPAVFVTDRVKGAVLIGNRISGNERNGLVVDRNSDGAVLYGNHSLENGGDGVAFFESSCAAVLMNGVDANARAGVKLRNSREVSLIGNRIDGNAGAAIRAYVAAVPKLGGPGMIPALATLDIGWNLLGANGRGLSLEGVSAARIFGNRFIRQSPRLVAGDLKGHAGRLLRDQETGAAVVTSSACRPRPPQDACRPPAWLAAITEGLPGGYAEDGDAAFCTDAADSIQRRAIERSLERAAPEAPLP